MNKSPIIKYIEVKCDNCKEKVLIMIYPQAVFNSCPRCGNRLKY